MLNGNLGTGYNLSHHGNKGAVDDLVAIETAHAQPEQLAS